MKQNYNEQTKFYNSKLYSAQEILKTPREPKTCLTQRTMNQLTPSTNKKQLSAQRKIVNIYLKVKKKQQEKQSQNKQKKIIKVRRKAESIDTIPIKQGFASQIQINHSCNKTQKKQISKASSQKINLCGQSYSYELKFQMNKDKIQQQQNLDKLIEAKKQQLYYQLNKIDKKMLTMERDLDIMRETPNKKLIMQIIKKKTISPAPIKLHYNVFKNNDKKMKPDVE